MKDEPKIRITERKESQIRRYGDRAWEIEGFLIIDGQEAGGLTRLQVPYRVWSRVRAGQVYTIRLHSVKGKA